MSVGEFEDTYSPLTYPHPHVLNASSDQGSLVVEATGEHAFVDRKGTGMVEVFAQAGTM